MNFRRLAFLLPLVGSGFLLGSCGKKNSDAESSGVEGYADPSYVHALKKRTLQGFRFVHGIER